MHRRLYKNVKQLRPLRIRVDFVVVATFDAKGDLEDMINGDVALFVSIGEMNEGTMFRKLQFMVECPWPWTHNNGGHLVLVLISVQELV